MSHWRTILKVTEFGVDFDKTVKQWKEHLQHSCRFETVLSTIHEVVETAEMEVVPTGFQTVNTSKHNLSFPSMPQQSSDDEHQESDVIPPVDTGEELGAQLGVTDIKERVKHKLAETFDEPTFNTIVITLQKSSHGKVNAQTVSVLPKQKKKLLHAPGYQITGDNLDMLIKVKHMSSTNQNTSIHWFNLNAVLNRVNGNHLQNDRPIKSVLEVENVDFLPSGMDNQDFLHDITALVARVVVMYMPAFSKFKDVIVQHIPLTYSSAMMEKSSQVYMCGCN